MGIPHNQAILIVDNDPASLDLISEGLEGLGAEIVTVASGQEALACAAQRPFSLILLDTMMPGMDGYATIKAIKENKESRHIPVIFVTAMPNHPHEIAKGYAAGGIDYLFKPVDQGVLQAKVKFFLEQAKRQEQLKKATALLQEQNQILGEKAIRDGLTGLFNHNYSLEQLAKEISKARKHNTQLSLFLMDLDFFKEVNDSCGHPFGDFVLRELARRVNSILKDADTFGRYGGEEFILITPGLDGPEAIDLAEQIRRLVSDKVFDNGHYQRRVTISIGVHSDFATNIPTSSAIIDLVDQALYQAKAEGRDKVSLYTPPLNNIYESGSHLRDIIDSSQRNQLTAIVEKSRAMTLATFEAVVHSQAKEYQLLLERNRTAIKVLDAVGKKLNLPDRLTHAFRRASKLHDLFRCFIHDSSLETEGPLEQNQQEMLFDQPLMLKELTALFDFFAEERTILYSHHENFDGSGYPDGLARNEIPIAARIFSVADAFVAMVSPVSPGTPLTKEQAIKELEAGAGQQFDPFLVDLFIELADDLDIYGQEE